MQQTEFQIQSSTIDEYKRVPGGAAVSSATAASITSSTGTGSGSTIADD